MKSVSSEVIISLRDVSKIYPMGKTNLYALNHIDLDIYTGEVLVVVGPSGSGKTTLLNLIGATDRPSEGKIFFKNQELTRFSDRQLTLYRRYDIGFVFQFYNLLPTLTALENIQVVTEISKNPMDPLKALELVGLKDYAGQFPAEMSGGQQQRVSIARAIAGNPSLLLCDEPTGALDSVMGKQIVELLVRINRQLKKNVILVTHNESLISVGDRVVYFMDGKMVRVTMQKS